MKSRSTSQYILRKSNSKFGRIIVLTGARQTGKTTLIKKLFPNHSYISIEDPVSVSEYKSLTAAQWNSLYPQAIIDEIQKEPILVESIKSVYDQYPNARYVLLGSSQLLLLRKIRESLAGRCLILELYPLTLPELLTSHWDNEVIPSYFQDILSNKQADDTPFRLDKNHPKKLEVFNTYLRYGGYPAISDASTSHEEKKDWLKNYVKTYLERDIRDLAELRNLEPFAKVQKILAINTAQLTNYSQIASEAGISSKTAQRFVEYMNISYQLISLQPWARNPRKRLVKSPKLHYLDIGVMRAVLQKQEDLNGHEFESAIVGEIYKQINNSNAALTCYHLRTSDGREVDLLIESEKGYIAIEIKKSSTIRSVDAKHLNGLEDILDKPILHKFILSNDLKIKHFDNNVIALPAAKFLM